MAGDSGPLDSRVGAGLNASCRFQAPLLRRGGRGLFVPTKFVGNVLEVFAVGGIMLFPHFKDKRLGSLIHHQKHVARKGADDFSS